MTENVLPTVGSKGSFKLLPPFDVIVIEGELYTCQAVRSINDYLANNEDPYTDIYLKYQLTQSDFDTDVQANMHIVSLQSDKGHWVHAPAKYILTYPLVNGVPYRSFVLTASLPAFPTGRDLTFLNTEITNLCRDTLGVTPVVRLVESSRVVLVSTDKHDTITTTRTAVTNGRSTDRARYIELEQRHTQALAKIAALEEYIKTRLTI